MHSWSCCIPIPHEIPDDRPSARKSLTLRSKGWRISFVQAGNPHRASHVSNLYYSGTLVQQPHIVVGPLAAQILTSTHSAYIHSYGLSPKSPRSEFHFNNPPLLTKRVDSRLAPPYCAGMGYLCYASQICETQGCLTRPSPSKRGAASWTST